MTLDEETSIGMEVKVKNCISIVAQVYPGRFFDILYKNEEIFDDER